MLIEFMLYKSRYETTVSLAMLYKRIVFSFVLVLFKNRPRYFGHNDVQFI